MTPVRVLIVCDDPLTRGGLGALLADRPELQVIGQAEIVEDAEELIELFRPELVLLAVGRWTDMIAALTRSLKDLHIPVVAIADGEAQAKVYASNGVHGILTRDAPASDMARAIGAVAAGLVVLSPELARSLLRLSTPAPGETPSPLTDREGEVLALLAQGLPNKSIAQRLHISEHTVKFHVNSILAKLGAESRTEAVVLATRAGLVHL
jgi:DNA-binding NarL/FixJ family response regulator